MPHPRTLISTAVDTFSVQQSFAPHFYTLHFDLQLYRALAEGGGCFGVFLHPQQLVTLLDLVVRTFSIGVGSRISTLGLLQ